MSSATPNPQLVTKLGGFIDQPFGLIIGQGAPTAALKRPVGVFYYDEVAQSLYGSGGVVNNQAVWIALGGGSVAISNVLGTANQITSSVVGGVATLSIPAAFQAPGSVTAATGLVATTGGVTASAGNISASAGSVSASTTVTGGTGVTATTGNIVASTGDLIATAGAVSAGTTVTATLGAITATNGNLVLGTAGNKLVIAAGANASVGTATLVAGTVTVATTAVTTNSKIFVTVGTLGTVAAPQAMYVDAIVNGTSFDITSADGTDTSNVNWFIIN